MGLAGFTVFQLIVGGTALAALMHIAFMADFVWTLLVSDGPEKSALLYFYAAILIAGYLTSMVLGAHGLARRHLLRHAWVLALTPLYWVMLSCAAWRALAELIFDPHRWDKTEHGLAKTSRLRSSVS
jgi:hypothetical protein